MTFLVNAASPFEPLSNSFRKFFPGLAPRREPFYLPPPSYQLYYVSKLPLRAQIWIPMSRDEQEPRFPAFFITWYFHFSCRLPSLPLAGTVFIIYI